MRVFAVPIVVAALATIAQAGPSDAEALAHLDRGVAAYRARDFALAHRELEAAQRLAPDRANPYRWLALTEAELGDCTSALANIEAFLSRVPALDERISELSALRERCLNDATISFDSTPPGASVRIDGAPTIGTTPITHLTMRPGRHDFIAALPGYQPGAESVVLYGGGARELHFALAPVATPITHRWWFWAAIGGVAIAAVGVTYAVTRDHEATLPGITCDPTGCR